MKVLLCHNFYQQPGGEDQSFADEARLLEARGHQILRYTVHNDAIAQMSRAEVAWRTLWNPGTYGQVRALLRRERPDVMHCTNTFPLLSPAIYYAARREGVPVVQALRNYRLLCPNALFLRDGHVCEDCLGKSIPWPAVWHKCYRDQRSASAVVTAMLVAHRVARTWQRTVDLYFTLTQFARGKFLAAGFPADRLVVKPNFIHPDPGPGSGAGGYVVFVGRLSPEKGLDTLLRAWSRMPGSLALKIVGDGPQSEQVRQAGQGDPRIQWLGRRSAAEVLELVGEAACLVMPSIWYETFGRTIIEAYARGTPVLASRLGAMAELVAEGQTGLLFTPGDAAELANQLQLLLADPQRLRAMRQAARLEYEHNYTAERNYYMLESIYRQAQALFARRFPHRAVVADKPVVCLSAVGGGHKP